MLLNAFLKEHRKVEEQEATMIEVKSTIAKQEATMAEQQEAIQALTTTLKKQAAQLQKVSEQIQVSKTAPRLVDNNQ